MQGLGFKVWGLEFRVSGFGFWVFGLGFRVWGLGFNNGESYKIKRQMRWKQGVYGGFTGEYRILSIHGKLLCVLKSLNVTYWLSGFLWQGLNKASWRGGLLRTTHKNESLKSLQVGL